MIEDIFTQEAIDEAIANLRARSDIGVEEIREQHGAVIVLGRLLSFPGSTTTVIDYMERVKPESVQFTSHTPS